VAADVPKQVKVYSNGTYHFDDSERTHPLGHEFLSSLLRKVLSAKQHKLIWMVCDFWTIPIVEGLLPVLC